MLIKAVREDGGGGPGGRDVALVAIGSLGEIGGMRGTKALTEIWYDEGLSKGCREGTLTALGMAGDPGSLSVFDEVLAGEDDTLRDNAVLALGMTGKRNREDGRVLGKVIASLRNYLHDRDPKVRANSAECLGWIGDKSDIELLRDLLQDEYRQVLSLVVEGKVVEKEAFPVRERAAEAIQAISARLASE